MNLFDSFKTAGESIRGPVCVSVGVFDGVHIGHQRILERTREMARRLGAESLVISFFPHPLSILDPENTPRDIMPRRRKIALLRHYGCENLIMLRPTEEMLRVRAKSFMDDYLFQRFEPVGVVVGHDFAFGYKREGDIGFLEAQSARKGFELDVVRAVKLGDTIVSSTEIRELLGRGDVDKAARMLGRSPSLEGHVALGEGRGRNLGFPTANFRLQPGLCAPRHGVYAALTRVRGRQLRPGVLHIGANPTFAGREVLAEVFLFDSPGDIYGKSIRSFLVRHIRPTRRFSSAEALVERMKQDVEKARVLLDKHFDQIKCI